MRLVIISDVHLFQTFIEKYNSIRGFESGRIGGNKNIPILNIIAKICKWIKHIG